MSDPDNDSRRETTSSEPRSGAATIAGEDQLDIQPGAEGTGHDTGGKASPLLSWDQSELAGDADDFTMHSVEYWDSVTPAERKAYYSEIEKLYVKILDEFFQQANASAGQYLKFVKRHLATRRLMIVLSGFLALLNVLIAYTAGSNTPPGTSTWWMPVLQILPLFAALYATALAVYSSLESLYGYAGRAQGFREVRELFLNSGREYEMLWQVKVRPFGFAAPACVNASIAYRRIVTKDIEVRRQAKELVERTSEKEQTSKAT